MKKTLLLTVFTLPLFLNAQLTSDDFESYSEGSFDSQWNAGEWEGWMGGTSDAFISNVQANSGSNSLLILNDNNSLTDLVGLFGVLNSGIYELSFMQYVPANYGADYNFNHDYPLFSQAAADFLFGEPSPTEGMIYTNNEVKIFTPVFSQWIENRFVFNFNIDEAAFYYNGVLTHTWQISTKWNGSAGPNQIKAINFYAACFDCIPLAYYDDFSLEEVMPLDFDISLKEEQRPSEYTMVPKGYVKPFSFETDVSNLGASTVNNVEVTANVYDSGNTLVHSESIGSIASLAPGASNTFYAVSNFTPSAIDDYTIEYVASVDETDGNLDNNNSDLLKFTLTEEVYARDDSNYTNGFGFNNLSVLMGQNFEFIADASIKSIAMSYAGAGVGDTIVGLIYSTINGTPDAVVEVTEPFVLETAGSIEAEVYVDLNFSTPVELTAGNYVFVVEQKGINNIFLSTSPGIFTPSTTWASTNHGATWQNIEDFGYNIAFNIRPILDLINKIEELPFVEVFTLSPNPTNGKATISLELAIPKDLKLEVFNLQGQLIQTIRDYNVDGLVQYPLDLTMLANGIYMVRLTIDNQITSRKFNLMK